MRNVSILFLLFLSFFVIVFPAQAHFIGQPAFFKVNGLYSGFYPLIKSQTVISSLQIPQDSAPANYLVNKQILFTIDTNQLQFPKSIVSSLQFYWNFGDGTFGDGIENTHTYSHMGSYILTVLVATKESNFTDKQLLESIYINVLPTQNYILPKSVIKINGKQTDDPKSPNLSLPINTNLLFDASLSTASTEIVSYKWDFGDGYGAQSVTYMHKYQKAMQVFPILRVTDANGFFSDSSIETNLQPKVIQNYKDLKNSDQASKSYILEIVISLIIFSSALFTYILFRKTKRIKSDKLSKLEESNQSEN